MVKRDSHHTSIQYRPARRDDCSNIADPIYQTSGGILDYLYAGLIGDSTVVEELALFLMRQDRYDCYQSVMVAEYHDKIVGVVSSYPAALHGIDQEMIDFFPPERLDFVREFFSARVEGSFYLSAIHVHEEFRVQGIARELIELTKQRARDEGYDCLSLLVMADNKTAQAAYQKSGFRIVRQVALGDHPLIPHQGGLYLLAVDI